MLNDIMLHLGDCLDVLPTLEAESIDAVVTDPPYELGFMGRKWDSMGIAFQVETWGAVLRVLKPGGHLLAFGGTRTHHRLMVAIEDAGFEIRDCLMWLHGSGFPKSLDVSKAIDKAAGAERRAMGKYNRPDGSAQRTAKQGFQSDYVLGDSTTRRMEGESIITVPATDAACQWQGWGTALKPAYEPIILARRPLSEPNVAANVLRWGTGALNIDGCRVAVPDSKPVFIRNTRHECARSSYDTGGSNRTGESSFEGRWPANVVLDEQAATMLDEQSGISKSRTAVKRNIGISERGNIGTVFAAKNRGKEPDVTYGDSGGASRFFYCAKASRAERGTSNLHPTVKPIALMRYLVRLVTPPGGLVLDPFAGSGSTLIAAMQEGFCAIGIEKEQEYVEIIKVRLSETQLPLSLEK